MALPSCLIGESPASSLATVFVLVSSVCPPRQASTDFHVTRSSWKRIQGPFKSKRMRAHLFGWKALRTPIFEVRQHLEEVYGQGWLHAHCKAKKEQWKTSVHHDLQTHSPCKKKKGHVLNSSANSSSLRKTSTIGYSIPRHIEISACTSSIHCCLDEGCTLSLCKSASVIDLHAPVR